MKIKVMLTDIQLASVTHTDKSFLTPTLAKEVRTKSLELKKEDKEVELKPEKETEDDLLESEEEKETRSSSGTTIISETEESVELEEVVKMETE